MPETGEAPSEDQAAELSMSGASGPEQAGGSGRPSRDGTSRFSVEEKKQVLIYLQCAS